MSTSLIIIFIIAMATAIAGYLLARFQGKQQTLDIHALQTQLRERDGHIVSQQEKIQELQQRCEHYLEAKAESHTRLETALEQIIQLEQRNSEYSQAKEAAIHARFEAEKQVERMQQEVRSLHERMADWEKTKEESLKTAKEAMFSTGGEVFRKEAEEMGKKTLDGFQGILKSVASLQDRVGKSEASVDTLWRSLSSPAAAGNFAEFGLENTFKHYGLEPGRDFVMQYSIAGESNAKLRPDAVVFLPGGNVLVVDSKASKFFLELAEAKDTPQEQAVLENLKRTMHEHIKSLGSKGYKEAIREYHKQAAHKEDIRHIISVMFIQTDTALEKICTADPSLKARADKEDIILSGPTGLAGIMSFARYELSREQQLKNQEAITAEISNLLSSIETVVSHAMRLGKGLESAANHYTKFAGSLNSNLLSKARKLSKLGVPLASNKQLPSNLPSCHLLVENPILIEGEAEELPEKAEMLLEES